MRHRQNRTLSENDVTPESLYLKRRELIKGIGAGALGLATASCMPDSEASSRSGKGGVTDEYPSLDYTSNTAYSTEEEKTPWEKVTTYNNFYEFGTGKADPAARSGDFKPKPWSVAVSGEAEVTGSFSLEDILKPHALEERIYRLRCVEAWSMVVPWIGFPLRDLIARFKPTSNARFVQFKTLYDPKRMPGQTRRVVPWPYTEGLRMDEAMHPLAILAVGLYGKELPNQNGAPLRLVVPWKYGFKSIKSIVSIEFTKRQPVNSWQQILPDEYGFYANVNPEVDHPRWSQASERRIGPGFSLINPRIPTLPFNGYANEVASLYLGMDLRRNF